MHRFQTVISILCVRLLIAPVLPSKRIRSPSRAEHFLAHRPVPHASKCRPSTWRTPAGWNQLLRAGRLYLSMQDCIALALENNLDIEIQRYGPEIADAQVCARGRAHSRRASRRR
jgi:hypothetical protein